MALDALKALEQWLETQKSSGNQELVMSWRTQLMSRIDRLVVRSFREDIHLMTQRCIRLMGTSSS